MACGEEEKEAQISLDRLETGKRELGHSVGNAMCRGPRDVCAVLLCAEKEGKARLSVASEIFALIECWS